MHRHSKVEQYRRIQSQMGIDEIYLHKGWGRILGELYDTEDRSQQQYFHDLVTHMNTRVLLDPQKAIGGDWVEGGKKQLDIMRSMGMGREHSLLDFGCGTLRAGRYFIDFLDDCCYTGIDVSPEAIRYANKMVRESSRLAYKSPRIIQNDPLNDEMIPLTGEKFDFIVCLWVCYDMPEDIFRQFLHEAIDHMHKDSVFVFSYVKRDHTRPPDDKLFSWMHDYRIVDEVVQERGVVYEELPFTLHREDEQVVGCIERDD